MAYEDDRDLDLDRSLYEEDPAYEADTYFGERLDDTTLRDSDMDAEEYEEDETPATADESFGESLQREDSEQRPDAPDKDSQHEAEDAQDEGLMDKAKRKIDQMTSPDE
jgi:hypothetical protein